MGVVREGGCREVKKSPRGSYIGAESSLGYDELVRIILRKVLGDRSLTGPNCPS